VDAYEKRYVTETRIEYRSGNLGVSGHATSIIEQKSQEVELR